MEERKALAILCSVAVVSTRREEIGLPLLFPSCRDGRAAWLQATDENRKSCGEETTRIKEEEEEEEKEIGHDLQQ